MNEAPSLYLKHPFWTATRLAALSALGFVFSTHPVNTFAADTEKQATQPTENIDAVVSEYAKTLEGNRSQAR